MTETDTKIIQEANDAFRKGEPSLSGQYLLTQGIAATLEESGQAPIDIIDVVRGFDTFTEDNDPNGTHEFGSFEFAGETCFWKIDLYDNDLQYGSPDPTDPSKTTRVMTIMLASEY